MGVCGECMRGAHSKTVFDGARRGIDGERFTFPPQLVAKVVAVENTGPASQPAKASGTYTGSLLFSLPTK